MTKMEFFVLLLCLTTINKVLSLECFFTNFDNLTLEEHSLPETVQDCEEHYSALGASLSEDSFSCYQVDVIKGSRSYPLKVCTLREDCDYLKLLFKRKILASYPRHKVKVETCKECRKDRCNSGSLSNMKFCVGCLLVMLLILLL